MLFIFISILVILLLATFYTSGRLLLSVFMFAALTLVGLIHYLILDSISGFLYTQVLIIMSLIFIISTVINSTKRLTVLGDGSPKISLFIVLLTGYFFYLFVTVLDIEGNDFLEEYNKVIKITSSDMSVALIEYTDLFMLLAIVIICILLLTRAFNYNLNGKNL